MIFVLLAMIAMCILIFCLVLKLVFRKEIILKEVFIYLSVSIIISIVISFVIEVLFIKFDQSSEMYLVPLISVVLFLVLNFILFKTKSKIKNSILAIVVMGILFLIYITIYGNFKNDLNNKFLFNLNSTNKLFEKNDHKIQNEYKIFLGNESENKQDIKLEVQNEEIKIIQPLDAVIHLQAKERLFISILLESNQKDIKSESINIKATNGQNEEMRSTIFIYSK
jgi:K+ transporter